MTIDNLIFDARNLITVLSLLSFVGIVWWAYSAGRKPAFDEAASLPFADDPADPMHVQRASGEKNHG